MYLLLTLGYTSLERFIRALKKQRDLEEERFDILQKHGISQEDYEAIFSSIESEENSSLSREPNLTGIKQLMSLWCIY